MGIPQQWKKTPKNRKAIIFLFLGIVALIGIIIGLFASMEEKDGEPIASAEETSLESCSSFVNGLSQTDGENVPNTAFYHEGLACNSCNELSESSSVFLSECESICGSWNVTGTSIVPIESTCSEINIPTELPLPGSIFECPPRTYKTKLNTGCLADSIADIKLLLELCLHLEDGNATIETCIDTCETIDNCGGISISDNGLHCFVFTEGANEICNTPIDNQNVCKPIKDEIECFEGLVTYDQAEIECVAQGLILVSRPNPDDFDIQLQRINQACGNTPEGCFFDGGDENCRFVENGEFNLDNDCQDERGFCCERITETPTVSPTESPTERLFFIPDNCEVEGVISQLNQTEAQACCDKNDADLAAIVNEAEQDFAYSVCLNALDDENNDCGCWIGVERDALVVSVDPIDFFFTDGSGFLLTGSSVFSGFEQEPEVKPDNQDNRNEACVHMRPFSDGGWNDLPCDGNCDSNDQKPLPLCRLRTEAPTTSPTFSPTKNPTRTPTFSPTKNPTRTPTQNPTNFPSEIPSKRPTAAPTFSPTKSPSKNPTQNPTKFPSESPSTSPTDNPTKFPSAAPTESPTKFPSESPTKQPTQNPTKFPSESPTESPSKNPTQNPTNFPSESPSTSPTDNPTKFPSEAPTESPTKFPSESPTKQPTDNPTKFPSESPTKSPSRNPTVTPTLSPTNFPSESPTGAPTDSPTKFPSESPTDNPTKFPSESPTQKPSANPTINPTKNPTLSPTKFPSESPTKKPTESPTKFPSESPTESPTKNPTKNPTKFPSASPTQSPSESPTKFPSESPSNSPTQNPTNFPSESPTLKPSSNPTESPTNFPSESPTSSPTKFPSESPTLKPSSNPTESPTKFPSESPTFSPIHFIGSGSSVCRFGTEEYIWTFTNININTPIPFSYTFVNPNGNTFIPGVPGSYPGCFFQFCLSSPQTIFPGETYRFVSPTDTISVSFPCDQQNPTEPCNLEAVAPDNLVQCECDNVEFFSDDFESYPVKNNIQEDDSPEFFDNYETNGSVDVKGLDPTKDTGFSSNFRENPCIDEQCIDIDGSVVVVPELNTLGLREVNVDPSDAFFNRICTLNFHIRGNSRCGKFHDLEEGISNPGIAFNRGCLQFNKVQEIPLEENLTATITEEGFDIELVVFEGIRWDQPFLPFGVTTDISNQATNVGGSWVVVGGEVGDDGNIGPFLDNVDLTCCCPELDSKFAGRIIEVSQGLAFDGLVVPSGKSDFTGLIGHSPSYFQPYTYSLGLGGFIVIEFDLGITKSIRIFEESFLCCDQFDPEDALIEASIDGITFFTLATTLKGQYTTVVTEFGSHIRYVDVEIPNGACYKFLRITDRSDPDSLNCDGFDLVSVEVLYPCCPTNVDFIETSAPTAVELGASTSNFALGGSTASLLPIVVAGLALLILGALVAMTVVQNRNPDAPQDEEVGVETLSQDDFKAELNTKSPEKLI